MTTKAKQLRPGKFRAYCSTVLPRLQIGDFVGDLVRLPSFHPLFPDPPV